MSGNDAVDIPGAVFPLFLLNLLIHFKLEMMTTDGFAHNHATNLPTDKKSSRSGHTVTILPQNWLVQLQKSQKEFHP